MHTRRVGARKVAFCKTEVVDRVEKICFADTVRTTDSYHPGTELKRLAHIVFELYKRYRLDL